MRKMKNHFLLDKKDDAGKCMTNHMEKSRETGSFIFGKEKLSDGIL